MALRSSSAELIDVLTRHGFRPCDIPQCHCDGWHYHNPLTGKVQDLEYQVGMLRDERENLMEELGRLINALRDESEQESDPRCAELLLACQSRIASAVGAAHLRTIGRTI